MTCSLNVCVFGVLESGIYWWVGVLSNFKVFGENNCNTKFKQNIVFPYRENMLEKR